MGEPLPQSYRLLAEIVPLERLAEASAFGSREQTTLPSALVRLGLVGEQALAELLSRQLSLPLIGEDALHDLSTDAVCKVNPEIAHRRRVIPIAIDGDELTLVMSDPTDEETAEEVAFFGAVAVSRAVTLESLIDRALDELYSGSGSYKPEPASGELRALFSSTDAAPPSSSPRSSPILLTTPKQADAPAAADSVEHLETAPLEPIWRDQGFDERRTARLPRIDYPEPDLSAPAIPEAKKTDALGTTAPPIPDDADALETTAPLHEPPPSEEFDEDTSRTRKIRRRQPTLKGVRAPDIEVPAQPVAIEPKDTAEDPPRKPRREGTFGEGLDPTTVPWRAGPHDAEVAPEGRVGVQRQVAAKRVGLSRVITDAEEYRSGGRAQRLAGRLATFEAPLRASTDLTQLAETALEMMSLVAERRIILRHKRNVLSGWFSDGPGLSKATIQRLWMPADPESVFGRTVISRVPYIGPLLFGKCERIFATHVGRHPPEILLVPLIFETDLLGLLYGDTLAPDLPLQLLRHLADVVASRLGKLT